MISNKKYKIEIFSIITLIFISRIPFIFNSLGIDFDIWREYFCGKQLFEKNIYEVSRFPGYPFSEITFALVYKLPYFYINLISVIFTIGASIYFYKIILFFKGKNPLLMALTLSFVPIIYINSTIAIEYNWSLFFILGTTFYILKKNIFWASLFFGLIISTRFNNVMFYPVYLFLIYFLSDKNLKITLRYGFCFFISAIIFFSPVLIKYKGDFLYHYGVDIVPFLNLISLMSIYIYGLLGIIIILGILCINLIININKININNLKKQFQNKFIIFCFGIVILNHLFFLKFPLEAGYLIPSVPFILILFNYYLKKNHTKIICIVLIISPFLLHISSKSFQLIGSIFINEKMENQQIDYVNSIIIKINKLPENSKVCVGYYYEVLFLNDKLINKNKITETISKKELRKYHNNNFNLYYTKDGNEVNINKQSLNLKNTAKNINDKFLFNR